MSTTVKFSIGDFVVWSSQSQGSHTVKSGEVIDILPVGAQPPRELYPSLWKGAGPGIGRNHESYIVKVGRRYYWPRVSQLTRGLRGAGGEVGNAGQD